MKKIILVTTLLVVTLIITSIFIFSTKQVSAATDYGQSLSYSIQFYDGNKCGPEVGDNQSFNWR
ncbi:MAG: glycoside hydrolase, partial [Clostridiales bacterium]